MRSSYWLTALAVVLLATSAAAASEPDAGAVPRLPWRTARLEPRPVLGAVAGGAEALRRRGRFGSEHVVE
jgi:hypothetical protein